MLSKALNKRWSLSKARTSKWILKDGGKIPALSKEEAKNIQVTVADVESAVTHVDLSVAVRLLVRSKSWSTKVQDRAQHNAMLRAEIENLKKEDLSLKPINLDAKLRTKSTTKTNKLFLDVLSPETVDNTGKPKQPRALTMPAPRELRKDTGGLANEFKMKIERPAQTPTALLDEIRKRKQQSVKLEEAKQKSLSSSGENQSTSLDLI